MTCRYFRSILFQVVQSHFERELFAWYLWCVAHSTPARAWRGPGKRDSWNGSRATRLCTPRGKSACIPEASSTLHPLRTLPSTQHMFHHPRYHHFSSSFRTSGLESGAAPERSLPCAALGLLLVLNFGCSPPGGGCGKGLRDGILWPGNWLNPWLLVWYRFCHATEAHHHCP